MTAISTSCGSERRRRIRLGIWRVSTFGRRTLTAMSWRCRCAGHYEETSLNGAESLVRTLLNGGIDTCFANPGTSELHFVSALDRVPGMRCVLGLFEGVVTGCADGYARMAEKPAVTLLHCGPGLANGLANLHNARRACTPMVNIVGDQASYHRPLDALLTADTEGWARPVSAWVRTSANAATVGADAAAAVEAARTAPGQIATLIVPADVAWNEGGIAAESLPVPATATGRSRRREADRCPAAAQGADCAFSWPGRTTRQGA